MFARLYGTSVQFTDDVELEDTVIKKGERGRIVSVYREPFEGIEIEIDCWHRSLARWDNCAVIERSELQVIKRVSCIERDFTCGKSAECWHCPFGPLPTEKVVAFKK